VHVVDTTGRKELTACRTYVAAQWPLDPKPLGRTLEDMHRRIQTAAKAKADAGAAAGMTSTANGTKTAAA